MSFALVSKDIEQENAVSMGRLLFRISEAYYNHCPVNIPGWVCCGAEHHLVPALTIKNHRAIT